MEQSLQSNEEPLNIKREYPTKKQEKRYPERYNSSIFEKFNEMNADTELQNDYKKWKDGINYKTNRKIIIGGKIHRELKQKFMIGGYNGVLFDILNSINVKEYLQETEKIKTEIDNDNDMTKDYNKLVDSIIEQIERLGKWKEFIEFEGLKYGIPYVYKDMHRGNNCFGLIKQDYYEGCRCHCCEDWGGCSNPTGTQYYKCEKCGYKYSFLINHSKNYKGK